MQRNLLLRSNPRYLDHPTRRSLHWTDEGVRFHRDLGTPYRGLPFIPNRKSNAKPTNIASPTPTEIKHHICTFLEARCAPAISPTASLLFTWVALTIAIIPVGKKQNIVTKTANSM